MAQKRALGTSGLQTAPLMLGGNVFGWTIDRAGSFAVLDAFVAHGGTLIDTSDVYSAWVPGNQGGESETIIGEWLKESGKRQDVLIATKVGLLDNGNGKGLTAASITSAIEASLKRLGTDVIDLYFGHRDDPDTPLEETLAAFDALVRAGKVRALGASNYSAARTREALDISAANGFAAFSVIEPHYNLIERREYEGPLQDLVVAAGLGAVPYYGLASGYLTGKYRDAAHVAGGARAKAVQRYFDGKGPAILAAMDIVAKETGASLAAIALAWLAAQPGVVAPIASATSPAQVAQLAEAMELILTPDQRARLDTAGH
jgi:aryl-alcohol dehydrogenase-like predicted oxidoreductase